MFDAKMMLSCRRCIPGEAAIWAAAHPRFEPAAGAPGCIYIPMVRFRNWALYWFRWYRSACCSHSFSRAAILGDGYAGSGIPAVSRGVCSWPMLCLW